MVGNAAGGLGRRARIGIIGCGDVTRDYLPSLAAVRDLVEIVAAADARPENAARLAATCADWSPEVRTYTDHTQLLAAADSVGIDGVFNLTPAPLHYAVNLDALAAGLHVFTEKTLAHSVEAASELITLADKQERMLICAPGIMATPTFQWLRKVLDSGRLGTPTVAVGQRANLGPAAWRGYTGDPAVFYSEGVGPLVDLGVYTLHAMTGLLGPARRVQAMGGITIPERAARCVPGDERRVTVATPDVMMVQLDFGNQRYAQLLSSFATAASKAPALEIHCSAGAVSIPTGLEAGGPLDINIVDDSDAALSGWMNGLLPPANPNDGIIESGAKHFIRCLQGIDAPVLTAQHARHVLDIILTTFQSIAEGRALPIDTQF